MVRKITLVAIGKVKEKYLKEGISEYVKRIKPYAKLEVIELKDQGLEKEAKKLEPYISQNTYLLDPNGKQHSSESFSKLLSTTEGDLTFIIGGSDGFTDDLKKKSKLLSLSNMTFLHEMARLILVEQIYRGFMIINKRTYHK